MPHPTSISTALFDGHGFDTAIEEIAAAGGTAIEFAFIQGYVDFNEDDLSLEYGRRLGRQAAMAGLGRHAVSAHMDLACQDAVTMLRRRIEFARAVGAGILITNSSFRPYREEVLRTVAGVLDICRDQNVILALENPGDGTEQLIGNAADGVALLRAIDSPWVRFNYDVGNVYTYSDKSILPQLDMEGAAGFLVHLHLKDVVLAGRGWSFAPIGAGELPWPAIVSTLDRLAPDLPIGLEMPLRAARPDRRGPVTRREPLSLDEIRAALRQSLDFLGGLIAVSASTLAGQGGKCT